MDTRIIPDFKRTIYLFKKDKKGYNDMWELKGNLTEQEWKDMCDKNNFFSWSYKPWLVNGV